MEIQMIFDKTYKLSLGISVGSPMKTFIGANAFIKVESPEKLSEIQSNTTPEISERNSMIDSPMTYSESNKISNQDSEDNIILFGLTNISNFRRRNFEFNIRANDDPYEIFNIALNGGASTISKISEILINTLLSSDFEIFNLFLEVLHLNPYNKYTRQQVKIYIYDCRDGPRSDNDLWLCYWEFLMMRL
jgi:hypothetical protein